jgi:peptide/nickel transport system substrate-binding protein
MWHPSVVTVAVLTLLVVGCAPAPSQNQRQAQSQSTDASGAPPTQNRTLVLAHRYEPATLAPKILASNGPLSTTRLFNAALTILDDKGQSRPYLAEMIPQLNTDTWRVFPDGRMETTYRLRENLTWQDGKPLTAADFAFAFRVYKDASLGTFIATPQDAIDAVLAPDPRTVVVHWRSANAGGASLSFEDLDPLPTHLFETAYADYAEGRLSREAFLGDPLWSTSYVGAGPYRMERWEPGSQIAGTAFAGHALGRPKIERLLLRFFVDENTTLAAVLTGGQIDFTSGTTLRFQHLTTLKQEWEPSGKGRAIATPSTAVFLFLQQRPEYVGHEALLDIRVRRALAHAIDRQALNDGLFDGFGRGTETPLPPDVPFYAELDRRMTKYPLDLNRSAQLMAEAGFTRGADGFYADAQGRRFHIDFAVQNSTEIERMQAILADTWRRAGFEVRTVVIGTQLFTQQETRHTLPGLGYAFFTQHDRTFVSSEIGSPANRWSGSNRTGWVSPEYDRLYEEANATLDLVEHGRYLAQLMAMVTDYLPGYALYYSQSVYTWVAALQGPTNERQTSGFGRFIKSTPTHWNIHEWSFSQ